MTAHQGGAAAPDLRLRDPSGTPAGATSSSDSACELRFASSASSSRRTSAAAVPLEHHAQLLRGVDDRTTFSTHRNRAPFPTGVCAPRNRLARWPTGSRRCRSALDRAGPASGRMQCPAGCRGSAERQRLLRSPAGRRSTAERRRPGGGGSPASVVPRAGAGFRAIRGRPLNRARVVAINLHRALQPVPLSWTGPSRLIGPPRTFL